jgi:uncharacterized membrane protein YjfL (UPF0719 family)
MRLDFLLGFMAEALVILIAAKLVRDQICRLRGYQVNEMIVRNGSVAAATTQVGYLIGVLLGFLGTISGKGADSAFLAVAGEVAVAGLTAIILLTLADLLGDRLIFRGLEGPRGTLEGTNLALALGKAAVSVATGLVLRGAMSDPEASLLARIAWFAAAQVVMVLAVLLYCRLTPYDDLGEIGRNNLAAGFPIAGILLAVGFVMEAAVAGRSADSTQGAALQAARFLGFSLVLVYAFRLITDFVMLPRVKLSRAIVEEKNVAAGLQEGVSFLLASLIVTFFLA